MAILSLGGGEEGGEGEGGGRREGGLGVSALGAGSTCGSSCEKCNHAAKQ